MNGTKRAGTPTWLLGCSRHAHHEAAFKANSGSWVGVAIQGVIIHLMM
jgi:hypothetical protein